MKLYKCAVSSFIIVFSMIAATAMFGCRTEKEIVSAVEFKKLAVAPDRFLRSDNYLIDWKIVSSQILPKEKAGLVGERSAVHGAEMNGIETNVSVSNQDGIVKIESSDENFLVVLEMKFENEDPMDAVKLNISSTNSAKLFLNKRLIYAYDLGERNRVAAETEVENINLRPGVNTLMIVAEGKAGLEFTLRFATKLDQLLILIEK